jgi:hypothetical protein
VSQLVAQAAVFGALNLFCVLAGRACRAAGLPASQYEKRARSQAPPARRAARGTSDEGFSARLVSVLWSLALF